MSKSSAIVITDEALVPEEFRTVTVKMTAELWKHLQNVPWVMNHRAWILDSECMASLSLIEAEMAKPCEECEGTGNCVVHGGNCLPGTCLECNGSGKRRVPGAEWYESVPQVASADATPQAETKPDTETTNRIVEPPLEWIW